MSASLANLQLYTKKTAIQQMTLVLINSGIDHVIKKVYLNIIYIHFFFCFDSNDTFESVIFHGFFYVFPPASSHRELIVSRSIVIMAICFLMGFLGLQLVFRRKVIF